MKKKVLLVVGCMIFGLIGCHSEKATESGPQETIVFEDTVTTNEGTERTEQGKTEVGMVTAYDDKGSASAITQEQALAAIQKYCYANDPELEKMIKSGDYGAYFDVSTADSGEIVVLYRSYTAAQIRYYIDSSTGDVYVTELVPGIIDEEQRTDESFNIGKYID